MTRLWVWFLGLLEPDRLYRAMLWFSLAVALGLLAVALLGGDTVHWKRWKAY